MVRSQFLWKLYLAYALLILIFTVVVGFLIGHQIEEDSLQEVEKALLARASLLEEIALPLLQGSRASDLQPRVRSLGHRIGTRLTVIRADGVVLADSDEDPVKMDNHGNRPEVLAALSHEKGTARRYSDTLQTEMMYLALPVRNGQTPPLGYVRSSLSLSILDQRLSHLRSIVVFGALFAAIVALILGFFFARRFVDPLSSMTRVAESMADGDYGQRLLIARQDEIGRLGEAFNRLAKSCGDRMATIETGRAKLSTILAGMVEGVVAVDSDARVVHMNEAAGRILETSPDESIGKPIREVTRIREISEILSDTLKEGGEIKRGLRLGASPLDCFVSLHFSPLRNGGESVTGAVVVLDDISELQRSETVRRDFVANVSHELKTPIAAIRGLVETVIDDEQMSEETRARFLAKIRNQSMRLSTIVMDLLTISRLESEGGALTQTVDLRDTVQASAQALVATGEEQGIDVQIELPSEGVCILGDAEALGQITSNLLDNALKYTPQGGHVWVRVRQEESYAVIEVADTGIGIDAPHRERIFERFYRVDKARSRELGGTGLGLSIVKHIALAHNGNVLVESTPGTGSTFRVLLPLVLAEPRDTRA